MNPIDWPAELDAWESALAEGRDVTEHDEGGRPMTLAVEQAKTRLAIKRAAWGDAIKLLRERANQHRTWRITGWDNAADFLDANWPVPSTDGCPTTEVSSSNTDESKPAGSPALNAPVRSAERAALDRAIAELRVHAAPRLPTLYAEQEIDMRRENARICLAAIELLVPGSVQ